MVPTQHPELLATSSGLLLNELHCAPHNVLRPVLALLVGALALDTGAVCDMGEADFNTGVDIILYVARLAARVDNFVSLLVDQAYGKHRCVEGKLREIEVSPSCLEELAAGRAAIRGKLHGGIDSPHCLLFCLPSENS